MDIKSLGPSIKVSAVSDLLEKLYKLHIVTDEFFEFCEIEDILVLASEYQCQDMLKSSGYSRS